MSKLIIRMNNGGDYTLSGTEISLKQVQSQLSVQRPEQIITLDKPQGAPHCIQFKAASVTAWELIPDAVKVAPDPRDEQVAALQAQLDSLTAALNVKPAFAPAEEPVEVFKKAGRPKKAPEA